MAQKKNLEEAVREKVLPLLEETLYKSLGIRIPQLGSDISDKLANPHTELYLPLQISFAEAKRKFKEQFLTKELRFHFGNITRVAERLGIDRRSVHRSIKEFKLYVPRLPLPEQQRASEELLREDVDRALRDVLTAYKSIFHPQKMERLYTEMSLLSQDLAKVIPHSDLTWKEAEEEFEKQFLSDALKRNAGDIGKTAREINLRPETLYRKIKKLGLGKTLGRFSLQL